MQYRNRYSYIKNKPTVMLESLSTIRIQPIEQNRTWNNTCRRLQAIRLYVKRERCLVVFSCYFLYTHLNYSRITPRAQSNC